MSALALPFAEATLLAVGQRGELDGVAFELAGRTCVRGRAGAWNEWTLRRADGRARYLAESAGGLTLFEEGFLVPPWEAIAVGGPIAEGWLVVERGEAERVAAWGDAGDAPRRFRYVDLSCRSGARGAVELDPAGGPPRVFVGRRVALAELGLTAARPHPRLVPAPDVSRPAAVLDWLAPGDEGAFAPSDEGAFAPGDEGVARVRVLGIVARAGAAARWEEYLLHDAGAGARWLVLEDGAFSLARAVDAGTVVETAGGAALDGRTFTATTDATLARVVWAAGELPWAVAIGDEADVRTHVADDGSGLSLTKESTPDAVSWTLATPLPTGRVARAFGRRALPRPPHDRA